MTAGPLFLTKTIREGIGVGRGVCSDCFLP